MTNATHDQTVSLRKPVADNIMARFSQALVAFAERWFPDAYVFVLIAVIAVAAGVILHGGSPLAVSRAFGDGFWNLIPFTMQMALVAIGGYVVAMSMKRQGISAIEKGDVVLFYTGWLKLLGKDDKRYASVEPGLGREGARYLAENGVAAVGADTWAVEVIPFEKDAAPFEVHEILLPRSGVYILENMNTEELVKDKAWEFLFTLGPARLTGAVQAIINPIAIK